MYQFSRAIYRELSRDIDGTVIVRGVAAHEHVLHACEATIERLVSDRHYFARPCRTLFNEIRPHHSLAGRRPLDVHLEARTTDQILKSTEPETLPLS